MQLSLDALETLEAIVRHGSFAKAAAALNKVQSALSYLISQLEERLGLTLFTRIGRRAVLTDAGRTVLDEGRRLLSGARKLESLAAQLRGGWEPRLHVVVDGVLPMRPVWHALKVLSVEQIPTEIQIKVEFLGGVQDRFETERADLMLVKEFTPNEFLAAHPLPAVEMVAVVAASHALAQPARRGRRARALTLPDLQPFVELTVHDSSASRRPVDTHLFGGTRVFWLSDFHTKKEALLAGVGFGWMPVYLVRAELARGSLVELPMISGSRFTFVPNLVHRSDQILRRAGQRLLELLRDRV